jgi:hypothetical protein
MQGPSGVPTSARVDITTSDNVTFADAFQFDPPGPSGIFNGFAFTGPTGPTGLQWGFTGMNFVMDIKGNQLQTSPLLSIYTNVAGSVAILIDDYTNRILHFNVNQTALAGATGNQTGVTGPGLIPGEYIYQFRMFDSSSVPIYTDLMHGKFYLRHGL